jgi:glutamate-ammonia-ligase adenylyltransferase
MALTRSRMIAGDPGLSDRISAAIESVLRQAGEAATIITDARDMRARLEEAKPARSPWDLKARIGGIQDIEFIAQTLQLVHADKLGPAQASTSAALAALAEAEVIVPADAQVLVDSLTLYLSLSQLLRVAHGSGFDPDRASKGAIGALCQACSSPDLDSLKADLDARAERVRALFERYIHLAE